MSKQKSAYVVVDWGTWGIDVQLSTKIVIKDQLGIIREGDVCSLPGIDPVTKRPVMFEGEVLGVFGKYMKYLIFLSVKKCVNCPLYYPFLQPNLKLTHVYTTEMLRKIMQGRILAITRLCHVILSLIKNLC